MTFLNFPLYLAQHLDFGWTFILLSTRFIAMFATMPGIGAGWTGMRMRWPATMCMSMAAMATSPLAPLPPDWFNLLGALFSELLFGVALGLVPMIVITGISIGVNMASTSMGFGASALFDPTTGTTVGELVKLQGDIAVLFFLLLNGHHLLIEAAAGSAGITPGTFIVGDLTIGLMVDRIGDAFRVGIMFSAPVLVALLLTQYLMGIVSKAVPSVNIFIVSFPLTIGVGLFLTFLALPEMYYFLQKEYSVLDQAIDLLTRETTIAPAS